MFNYVIGIYKQLIGSQKKKSYLNHKRSRTCPYWPWSAPERDRKKFELSVINFFFG